MSRRLAPFLLLLLLVASLAGCRVREYVVSEAEAPLYASPALDVVLGRMPLGHHEEIVDGEAAEALRVRFEGRTGWVRRSSVRAVDYAHPELDAGAEREERLGRAIRDALASRLEDGTPDAVRSAISEGRLVEGMTREQVELAWGWPRTVLALAAGGERWIWIGHATRDAGAARSTHGRHGPPDPWGIEPPDLAPCLEEKTAEFEDGKLRRFFVRRYVGLPGDDPD